MKLSDFLPSPTPLSMFMFFITGMLLIIVVANAPDILSSLTPDAVSVGGDTIKKVVEVLTRGEL